jgi:hypothetical protein
MNVGHRPDRTRPILYGVVSAVLVVLLIFGLIAFPAPVVNAKARDKAVQLTAAFRSAGLTPPSQKFMVETLGADGGPVCADPGGALARARANQQLTNGAAHVGMRPVIAAQRVVQAEALILGVYCPERLPEFQEYLDGLEFADVLRGRT